MSALYNRIEAVCHPSQKELLATVLPWGYRVLAPNESVSLGLEPETEHDDYTEKRTAYRRFDIQDTRITTELEPIKQALRQAGYNVVPYGTKTYGDKDVSVHFPTVVHHYKHKKRLWYATPVEVLCADGLPRKVVSDLDPRLDGKLPVRISSRRDHQWERSFFIGT